jgi:hypothetical protein
MTTRSSGFIVTLSMFAIAACGGEFSTQATNGSDAAAGGATTAGGSPGTGGRTGTGGSTSGRGGTISGTGGISLGGSIGAGGATSSSEEGFRAELVRLYCGAFVGCCPSGGIVLGQTQCEASFGSLILDNFSSPRTGYYTFDSAAAARCLETLRTPLGPGCTGLPSTTACGDVFQGILKPGDPCNTAVECAHAPGDSQSCDPGPDGNPICIVKRRAMEGQPCVQDCEESTGVTSCGPASSAGPDRGRCFKNDGLYCSNGLCARRVTVGGLCDTGEGCTSDGTCDLSIGICVPLASDGKPCAMSSDCREELHCSTGLCTPDHAPGEACLDSDECGPGSCRGGTCSPLSVGISVVCATLSGVVPTP